MTNKYLLAMILIILFSNIIAKDNKIDTSSLLPKKKGMFFHLKNYTQLKDKISKHPLLKNQSLKLKEETSMIVKSIIEEISYEFSEEENENIKKIYENINAATTGQISFAFYLPNQESYFESYLLILQGEKEKFSEALTQILELYEKDEDEYNIENKEFKEFNYHLIKEDYEKLLEMLKEEGDLADMDEQEVEEYKKELKESIQEEAVCMTIVKDLLIFCNGEEELHKILTSLSNKNQRVDSLHENKSFYGNYVTSNQNDAVMYVDYRFELTKEDIEDDPLTAAFEFHQAHHYWFSINLQKENDAFEASWLQPSTLAGIFKVLFFKETISKPSAYIDSKVAGYGYLNFSMPDALTTTIDILKNKSPEEHKQFEATLQMMQAQFGIDLKLFIKSIGSQIEGFSYLKEDGNLEDFTTFHLADAKYFDQTLTTFFNRPEIKQSIEFAYTLKEEKTATFHNWALVSKNKNNPESFVFGITNNLFFISRDPGSGQKIIKILSANPTDNLASSDRYTKNRSQYKTALSGFQTISLKALVKSLQINFEKEMKNEGIDEVTEDDILDNPLLGLIKNIIKLDTSSITSHANFAIFYDTNKLKGVINILYPKEEK